MVVSEIIEAFILSGIAYIKPGCMHRFSEEKELIDYITLGPRLFNTLNKAVELGEKVALGKIGAPTANIGTLLSDVLKNIGGRLAKNTVFYDSTLALTMIALASSHALTMYKRNVDESRIERSLKMFLTSSTGKDSSALVHVTRTIGPTPYIALLNQADYTRTKIELEDISLYEIFYALSFKSISFKSLIDFTLVANTVKTIRKYYETVKDLNNSLVSAYVSLIFEAAPLPVWARRDLEIVLKEGVMVSKASAKKLFEIDRKLRREKISFNGLLPILTAATAISLILKYIA